MSKLSSLKNQLIIAMPSLKDPNFKQAVAYIFEHNEAGAMGIVINKPMDIHVDSIFEMLDIPVSNPELSQQPVLRGGPVAREQGFLIHRENDIGNGEIASQKHHIIITASKEDLITIPQDTYSRILVSLGYSGWGENQLEEEILQNDWLVAPLDPKILFEIPFHQRWEAAAASIGVDFLKLSPDVGHA